jgi:sporulation protein YlmC with PRC-barrel domain
MPILERIENWHGQDVLDVSGEKVGHLDDVYYDPATQEPVLLSVKSGLLGRQVALVPIAEAVLSRDYVRVPYTSEQVKQAQSGRVDEELTAEQVASVGSLFGLTLPASRSLQSASLIERLRDEAEKAQRRAHELELEAQRRHEEAEAARERAAEATEQDHAAEREREQAQADALDAQRRAEASGQPPQPQ